MSSMCMTNAEFFILEWTLPLKQSFVRAEAKIASHTSCQNGIKEHVEIVLFNARRIGTAHSLDRAIFTLVLRNEIEADWNDWHSGFNIQFCIIRPNFGVIFLKFRPFFCDEIQKI